MNGKFKIALDGDIVGVIKINLDVPQDVRQAAAIRGYGPQELENLVGQRYQEFIDYFGLEEQP